MSYRLSLLMYPCQADRGVSSTAILTGTWTYTMTWFAVCDEVKRNGRPAISTAQDGGQHEAMGLDTIRSYGTCPHCTSQSMIESCHLICQVFGNPFPSSPGSFSSSQS